MTTVQGPLVASVLSPGARDDSIAAVQRGTIPVKHLGWLLCILSAMAGHAGAQDLPGDPEAGARLAREVCAACHVVAEDQMVDPGIGPWFVDVAQHPATTALSLRVFLQTPHADMPDLVLSADETDDIISYILTLKGE